MRHNHGLLRDRRGIAVGAGCSQLERMDPPSFLVCFLFLHGSLVFAIGLRDAWCLHGAAALRVHVCIGCTAALSLNIVTAPESLREVEERW